MKDEKIRGTVYYVDDYGELQPFPDDDQDQVYYMREFFNYALGNNRYDLVEQFNRVRDKINPPIYDMSELDDDELIEAQIRNATREQLFAKNIVMMEFGEDFSEALLDVAEKVSNYQLDVILFAMERCRSNIDTISSWYDGIDGGGFSIQCQKAASERLTDAVIAIQEITNNGKLEVDLDWVGEVDMTLNEAIYAFKLEEKSLGIITGVINDVTLGTEGTLATVEIPSGEYDKRTLYRFHSPVRGDVLLYTRPEGWSTFDSSFEYGNRDGTEASISWIVNPTDPFNVSTFKNKDRVSALRIDREGRNVDENPFSRDRNPLRKEGAVSMDIAAIRDGENTSSGKISRLIAAGNAIRARRHGWDAKLNHNTNYFDQDAYGTEDGFRRIVEHVQRLANNTITLSQQRKIGHEAIKSQSVGSRVSKSVA